MKTMHTLAATLLAAAAGSAAAHTGHGHEHLDLVQGLQHTLGEPDHLLMLAFGFGLASLAAPRVPGLARRLLRALREHLRKAARREAA